MHDGKITFTPAKSSRYSRSRSEVKFYSIKTCTQRQHGSNIPGACSATRQLQLIIYPFKLFKGILNFIRGESEIHKNVDLTRFLPGHNGYPWTCSGSALEYFVAFGGKCTYRYAALRRYYVDEYLRLREHWPLFLTYLITLISLRGVGSKLQLDWKLRVFLIDFGDTKQHFFCR